MISMFNTKKLEDGLRSFYTAVGLYVGFGYNGTEITSGIERRSSLCNLLRKNPEFEKQCKLFDVEMCQRCELTQQPIRCRCPIGMEGYFMPVFSGKYVLGTIMVGEIILESDREQTLQAVLENVKGYGVDEEEVRKRFARQQVISPEQFSAVYELLNIYISALLTSDIFVIQEKAIADRIDDYIMENLSDSLTVSKICEEFCISKAKLNRVANSFYGTSIQKYIRNRRVSKSLQLLSDPNRSITAIAAEVGIPDYNYFTKIFKSVVGCTPSNWRRQTTSAPLMMDGTVKLFGGRI